jgi:hypothetical protein
MRCYAAPGLHCLYCNVLFIYLIDAAAAATAACRPVEQHGGRRTAGATDLEAAVQWPPTRQESVLAAVQYSPHVTGRYNSSAAQCMCIGATCPAAAFNELCS